MINLNYHLSCEELSKISFRDRKENFIFSIFISCLELIIGIAIAVYYIVFDLKTIWLGLAAAFSLFVGYLNMRGTLNMLPKRVIKAAAARGVSVHSGFDYHVSIDNEKVEFTLKTLGSQDTSIVSVLMTKSVVFSKGYIFFYFFDIAPFQMPLNILTQNEINEIKTIFNKIVKVEK